MAAGVIGRPIETSERQNIGGLRAKFRHRDLQYCKKSRTFHAAGAGSPLAPPLPLVWGWLGDCSMTVVWFSAVCDCNPFHAALTKNLRLPRRLHLTLNQKGSEVEISRWGPDADWRPRPHILSREPSLFPQKAFPRPEPLSPMRRRMNGCPWGKSAWECEGAWTQSRPPPRAPWCPQCWTLV